MPSSTTRSTDARPSGGPSDPRATADTPDAAVASVNVVVLRGRISGAPRRRDLPSGSTLLQFDVTTRVDQVAVSVPVAWFDPTASPSADDEVVVVGQVRRRFFHAGGATQSRTEVVAERVVAANRRRDVERALDRARSRVAGTSGG
jgi:single-strand DNA-binding protein